MFTARTPNLSISLPPLCLRLRRLSGVVVALRLLSPAPPSHLPSIFSSTMQYKNPGQPTHRCVVPSVPCLPSVAACLPTNGLTHLPARLSPCLPALLLNLPPSSLSLLPACLPAPCLLASSTSINSPIYLPVFGLEANTPRTVV